MNAEPKNSREHREKDGAANRLRVAFMTVQFDDVVSGPGTFTRYVRERLKDLRHSYTFFSDNMSSAQGSNAVRVRPRFPGQIGRYRAFHDAFMERHAKTPFDVVWYNTSPVFGIFSARATLGIPVVQMVSDYSNAIARWPLSTAGEFGVRRSIVRSVLHRFERETLRRCNMVVSNSEYLSEVVHSAYGVLPEKIRVLPKGVDLSRFRRRPTVAYSEPYRVLFLKTDYVLGGLSEVVTALADFPFRVELTVAGPPDNVSDDIRSLANRAGLEAPLVLKGRIAREEVPALIARHDIFCVPSHVEALGVSFLEAMACGVPVVASRVGGIPEVLDDGRAGWMVDPFDAHALRAALADVIEDEAGRAEKIERGIQQVKRYSVDTMLERLERLVDEAVMMSDAQDVR